MYRHTRSSWLGCLVAVVSVLYGLPIMAVAAESIETFRTTYDVQEGGRVFVVEEITYDFGSAERHGIFRTIPLAHPQEADAWYQERRIELSDVVVSRNDQSEPFTVTRSGEETEIKIGDADRTISGEHRYVISYEVAGALSYYENSAPDLYWNATGNDWNVPIEQAIAVVQPARLTTAERACWQGPTGATTPCDEIVATSTGTQFVANDIGNGRGLTIAQELDASAVDRLVVEETKWYFFWVPLLILLLGVAGWRIYRYQTEYDPHRTVIAQYEPYPDVLPMYTGILVDGSLDPKDITAGLLYLAQQGFLTITKTERKVIWLFDVDDYEVTLQKDTRDAPTQFHRTILDLLFASQPVGTTVALSDLKGDRSKQKANHKALKRLRNAIRDDLVERGFYERLYHRNWLIGGGVAAIFGFNILAAFLAEKLIIFSILGGVFAGLALVFLQRRRTRKGYEARNHIEGFKDFLSTTDKERFAFHNAPERNPETFMEYLPYAVALGVEEKWAEVFADITIPQPGWYHSNTGSTFSAAALTSDLGAFSSSFASSSGSSASSGSGSSGGGAGGGGGGSW